MDQQQVKMMDYIRQEGGFVRVKKRGHIWRPVTMMDRDALLTAAGITLFRDPDYDYVLKKLSAYAGWGLVHDLPEGE